MLFGQKGEEVKRGEVEGKVKVKFRERVEGEVGSNFHQSLQYLPLLVVWVGDVSEEKGKVRISQSTLCVLVKSHSQQPQVLLSPHFIRHCCVVSS